MGEDITDPPNSEILARIARIKAKDAARRADRLRPTILVTHEQTLIDRFGPAPDHLPPEVGESTKPGSSDD